jgi:hypothetical protein
LVADRAIYFARLMAGLIGRWKDKDSRGDISIDRLVTLTCAENIPPTS